MKTKAKKGYLAYIFLTVPILLWAATPLIVSELSVTLPISLINWLSTAFSIILLSIVLSFSGKWKVFQLYKKRDYITMLLMGAIGMFPYTALYYLAFSLAPANAGNINIINYTWPVWIIILSVFFLKEPLTLTKIMGILLSFAGVYLIFSNGNMKGLQVHQSAHYMPAYLSAGAGAFFWGLFSVLSKRCRFEPLSSLLIYNISAFLFFSVIVLFFTGLKTPSINEWILLFILGGCINGLGYLFWILALRYGDTARIANLVYLTPFIALVYIYIFRGTRIHAFQFAGLTLIVAGPVIQHALRIRKT